MPINDKEDKFQAVGGSHWGLLVYNVEKDNFLYLDSMNNIISNTGSIAAKIKSVKNQKEFIENDVEIFQIKEIPQQKNSYDCGMYVLVFTEVISEFLGKGGDFIDIGRELAKIDQNTIKEKRKEIKKLILSLAEKKAK